MEKIEFCLLKKRKGKKGKSLLLKWFFFLLEKQER